MSRALQGTVVRSEQLQLGGEDRRHLVASAKPFELENGSTGALLVLRDVTSQLEEEAWLMHLALHDPLTGLANRYLLLDYLRRVLLQFRTRGGSIALVFLDLDDFKMINDRFGHDVGDEVLVAVGRRIQGAVRSSDIVARLGGDEFVVAHAASDDPGEIEMVISRIRKTLTAPYQVRGQTLAVSASIGWVAADPRNEDPTTLLVRADREMYRRKSGPSPCHGGRPAMSLPTPPTNGQELSADQARAASDASSPSTPCSQRGPRTSVPASSRC